MQTALVVGGGHNGLITASYLAKAGRKVRVLERRHTVGGAAVTEEIVPGFKFSRASYLAGLLRPSIIDELKLRDHGLKFIPRNPSSFTPMKDGRYLLMGPDEQLNHKEISKFSKKDAEMYPLYEKELSKISRFFEQFLDEEPANLGAFTKKTSLGEKYDALMAMSRIGYRAASLGSAFPGFLEIMTAPANKILRKWFESEPLISTLATDSIIGALLSPNVPGSGYVLLHHVMGVTEGKEGIWSYVEGGMGGITQAIAKSAKTLGVEIQTDTHVEKINTSNGKITGVTLKGGEQIQSDLVISNATPHHTFTQLVDQAALPSDFLTQIKNTDYRSGVTKINLALDALPNFTCYPTQDGKPGPQHRGTIHICEDSNWIEKAYNDSLSGRVSRRPVIEMTLPSSLDPTVAPTGKHVCQLFVQYSPTHLEENSWKDPEFKKKWAETIYDVIEEYAPGFKKSIVGADVLTPLDLENIFGLTGGNIFHGAMGLDQLFWSRPAFGYSSYKTPIQGLYMCGAGTHPGGGVMGACGRNAAKRILKDNPK